MRGFAQNLRAGLSPRVRGNLSLLSDWAGARGSIPACAGEPAHYGNRRPHGRVYPRVCGGTLQTRCRLQAHPGLSPRVRGNLAVIPNGRNDRRSIPACAGEPSPVPQN